MENEKYLVSCDARLKAYTCDLCSNYFIADNGFYFCTQTKDNKRINVCAACAKDIANRMSTEWMLNIVFSRETINIRDKYVFNEEHYAASYNEAEKTTKINIPVDIKISKFSNKKCTINRNGQYCENDAVVDVKNDNIRSVMRMVILELADSFGFFNEGNNGLLLKNYIDADITKDNMGVYVDFINEFIKAECPWVLRTTNKINNYFYNQEVQEVRGVRVQKIND
jgi:hypothetical protein